MVTKRQPSKRKRTILDTRREIAKKRRSAEIVARARANKSLMQGVEDSLAARARGEKPVRLEDILPKDA